MRVLVCGDRGWTDTTMIYDVLNFLHPQVVIEGHARGADSAAHRWAIESRVTLVCRPAEWSRFGRAAGSLRNRRMLADQPDLVIAFHDRIEFSKGTADMLMLADKANIHYTLLTH